LWHGSLWLTDLCAGLAISAQFMADAQARANGKLTWFERFLLLRPLLFLGTFSYSFYLVNFPVIDAFASFVGPNWSIAQVFAAGTASILAALVVAYALYRVLERPFLTAYRRRGDAASLRSHRPAAATGD
jgi:peptidoglycan/LPS O-acetylase OafA/YrhL